MQNSSLATDARHHKPASPRVAGSQKNVGRAVVILASLAFLVLLLIQILYTTGATTSGFADWRPILAAYLLWAIAIGVGQVVIRGERGLRALFLLPAIFFTVAVVIFPTLFGIYIASLDWNLSSLDGPRFYGFNNLIGLFHDTYYWNALGNMTSYAIAVLGEYAVAFGLAGQQENDAKEFSRSDLGVQHFSLKMILMIRTVMLTGSMMGNVTCQNDCQPFAPSTLAASCTSFGIACKPASRMIMMKGIETQASMASMLSHAIHGEAKNAGLSQPR